MFQTLIQSKTDKESKVNIISWKSLRQSLLSISPEEATFARRGFHSSNTQTQQRLEEIGHTFLQGYHSAIADDCPESLISQLNTITPELCGFAFEGAAMGLALLDILTPWKCDREALLQADRIQRFLAGAGADHIYMVYVGMGWALARIPFGIERYLNKLNRSNLKSPAARNNRQYIDPLLGWLAIDGYGFHQGYFYAPSYVEKKVLPQRLSESALRVFDQGLGRSLWFVYGANVKSIVHNLRSFNPSRRADLWSGIGLACTYAGGVDDTAIQELQIAAGEYQSHLAQGAAFAAKTRQRAGNLTTHTEMATNILCGMSVDAAAEITDISLENLHDRGEIPAYEVWRQRIQSQF